MSPRRIVRCLISPFMPGGARGMVYVLLNLTVLTMLFSWCVLELSAVTSSSDYAVIMYPVIGTVFYMVIYMGFACWIGRLFSTASADIRPNHIRVLTLIVFAIGCILPLIASAAELINTRRYSYFSLTNPISTFPELADGGPLAERILIILGIAAFVAVAINLRAMWNGLNEVISLEVDDESAPVAVSPFQIPVENEPQPTAEA
jgi:hypothetical protein